MSFTEQHDALYPGFVRTWRERIGAMPEFVLDDPTVTEDAMANEIRELRAALEKLPAQPEGEAPQAVTSQHDNVRDQIGQVIADYAAEHMNPGGEVGIDWCSAADIDPLADKIVALLATPAAQHAESGAPVTLDGRICLRESIGANPDAMIILTQSFSVEAIIAVVDAHTDRNVAAALAAQSQGAQADEVAQLREELALEKEHLRQAVGNIAKMRAAPAAKAEAPVGTEIARVILRLIGEGAMDWHAGPTGDAEEDAFHSDQEELRVLVDLVNKARAQQAAAPGAEPHKIHELLRIYDEKNGDWCAIARAVESRYVDAPSAPGTPEAPAKHGDAKDAARYRWLRDHHIGDDPKAISLQQAKRSGLNAAVDAAMRAAQLDGGQGEGAAGSQVDPCMALPPQAAGGAVWLEADHPIPAGCSPSDVAKGGA